MGIALVFFSPLHLSHILGFPGSSSDKEPANAGDRRQETRVPSLAQGDPLEEGTATHSSILAWKISMDRGAWRGAVHGVRQD